MIAEKCYECQTYQDNECSGIQAEAAICEENPCGSFIQGGEDEGMVNEDGSVDTGEVEEDPSQDFIPVISEFSFDVEVRMEGQ